MTVLERDLHVLEKAGPGIQPQLEPWRVSQGDAGWTDREVAVTLLGAAAGALAVAISLYFINK